MELTGMCSRKKILLAILVLVSQCNVVVAQESDDATGFFATVVSTVAHDDNIYRVTDDLALSDNYLSLVPKIKLRGSLGKQDYELSYNGDYTKFAEYDDANFYDHNFRGKINLEHIGRLSSEFEAGYQRDHEDPGFNNRIQLSITEYNKFEKSFISGAVYYGTVNSTGRLEFKYRRTDSDYLNNDFDYLDAVSDQYTGKFIYRIAPKTKIYTEIVYSNSDYAPTDTFELDNSYIKYNAGINWQFTNKLTGDINVGYQDRDYDQQSLRDIDGLAFTGKVSWAINSYTKLVVEGNRESIDSSLEEVGGFLRTEYTTELSHEFSELIRMTAGLSYAKDELVFSSSREDKRYSYHTSIKYQWLRNIDLAIKYTRDERRSTNELAEFEGNVVSLIVTASLDE